VIFFDNPSVILVAGPGCGATGARCPGRAGFSGSKRAKIRAEKPVTRN